MITLFTNLIEQITKLLEIRQTNRQEYFDRYVKPAFETATLVHSDYRKLLQQLRQKIKRNITTGPVIRLLEMRRQEFLPSRELLRAIVDQRIQAGNVTRFEAGILGLLTGVVTTTDDRYFVAPRFKASDSSLSMPTGTHTVLDILQRLKRQEDTQLKKHRDELLVLVDKKAEAIDDAWKNIVQGYAEFQSGVLPKAVFPKKRRTRARPGITEIRDLVARIRDMLRTGDYSRSLPIRLEGLVGEHLPELHASATELRGIVHDLDNKEPNIEPSDLERSLQDFERGLARSLAKKDYAPSQSVV